MCFRPPSADQALKCPECGQSVNVVMGVVPDECPYCGAGFGAEAAAINAAAMGAPAAPAAPGAPSAPGAPKPPSAPGA